MTKKIIPVATPDVYWSGCTLAELLPIVQEALVKYGPLSTFEMQSCYSGEGWTTYIEVNRVETDEEEAKREAKWAAMQLSQKEQRRQAYEKLQKEFDGE